jgi:1-acyl-sn-glycerol-3-phosphate acyltransferase
MNWAWYRAGRVATRFILFCTMRVRTRHADVPERTGGYVLALSHQGHLDPFLAGTLQQRPIAWMTRKEFFKYGWARWLIRKLNGFQVNRQGIPVSAIRHAIAAARAGEVVGICPEGGVVCGADACFRGGRIRRGACSVAIRAGVPVIPCVILGSARLQQVGPWLPAKRGRLWVAYGQPILPAATKSTKQTRDALARQIESAYVALYDEMTRTMAVDPAWVA